jgi:biotin carboxyl carrier protein
MKVKVKVDGQTVEVEIADLTARPVVAVVEGESFEVWPAAEDEAEKPASPVVQPIQSPVSNSLVSSISAPIPGVIVAVSVKPGDVVTVGQELVVLEAMKMKNVIRSPRAGTIAAVKVITGQTVKHRDLLVEYGE